MRFERRMVKLGGLGFEKHCAKGFYSVGNGSQ